MKPFWFLVLLLLPVCSILAQADSDDFACNYDLSFFDNARDREITVTQYLITGPEEATVQKLYTELRQYPSTFPATKEYFDRLANKFCQMDQYALTAILVRKDESADGKYEVLLAFDPTPDIH